MKKGFTLIELLVVIVIVGILITIALPKYKVAMEKGRGLEGFADAAAISDALNTYYVRNYNSYAKPSGVAKSAKQYAIGTGGNDKGVAQRTSEKFFSVGVSDSTVKPIVTLTRKNFSHPYNIVFENEGGEVTKRYCSGNDKYCKALGAVTASGGNWFF